MFKLKTATILVLTILAALMLAVTASGAEAADRQITTTVDNVTVNTDKNGNEYVRVIAALDYQLNGVKYSKSVPIMGFGKVGQQMKNLKEGDVLNAIVSETEYRGRTSCSVITLLE